MLRRCLIGIITLLSFSVAYPQDVQTEKELTEAINSAKNANYTQAIPVLKKYVEMKGFDDYKTLEINIYLNMCYLATKNKALDVGKVNALTDSYLAKYGISKTESIKSEDEMALLFIAGLINLNVGNNEKMIFYLTLIKKRYEEKQLAWDQMYSIILSRLGQGYYNLSDYKSAFEVGQMAWKVNLNLFGEKNEASLNILDLLYLSYQKNNEPKKALEYIQKEADIGREFWGEKNSNYLICLDNLALAYSLLGEYQKALGINLKALELGKEVLGEKPQSYLIRLNNLASIYSDIGDHIRAIRIYQELVNQSLEILGKNDPDYFTFMNNLAIEFSYIGNNEEALEISLKVTELRKEFLGDKSPGYFNSLINLASIYSDFGDYLKALEINLEVFEKGKEVLGEMNPDYLTNLNNLAGTYSDVGDYKSALGIHQKIIEIRKEFLDERHPEYLLSLNNLAAVYSELGDYSKALEINLKVIELSKKVLGEKNPFYLTSLSNLASTYSDLGDFETALEINQKVVDLRREVLGEKHPDYLSSLNNQAFYYSFMGNPKKAFEIFNAIVKISKEFFGEQHQRYLTVLDNLALSEFELSKFDSALIHKIQVLNNAQRMLIKYFSYLTEYQRESFSKRFKKYFLFTTLFIEDNRLHNPESVCYAYDLSLFSKGLLLNTTIDFDKLIAEKGNPEAVAKFEELKLLKLQCQRLLEKPIAERYLNVDSLENLAQQKESELVKLSKEYGDYTKNLKITWKDVQANLQDKDVAIEFVEYPTLTDTVKYAALVLRKGWQNPRMISLFRKDQIEEFIRQDKDKIYSNGIVSKQIKELIWSPIEEVVLPGDRIYFSASGLIHQLAIENLPANDSLTLGDLYEMHRLSSTKELAIHQPEDKNTTAVLYGGLQYDLPEDKMVAESKKYEKKENLYAMRGYSTDTTVRKGWNYLPGTLNEVNQIDQLMASKHYQISEYTGERGNEESFKSLSGKKKSIIHIATHGFFLPIEESRKNLFMMQRIGDQPQDKATADPMLRSGLMLSGGNRAWQGDKVPDNIEDGVLTAKEISRMDLRGTDLVVLSACETGLGDVSSEGVFGLQRSFKQAGVQTLVMSLWEVNDEATRFMMTEFYSELLSGKEKREAFLDAKRKCKEKFPLPRYWAAFIMLD